MVMEPTADKAVLGLHLCPLVRVHHFGEGDDIDDVMMQLCLTFPFFFSVTLVKSYQLFSRFLSLLLARALLALSSVPPRFCGHSCQALLSQLY